MLDVVESVCIVQANTATRIDVAASIASKYHDSSLTTASLIQS